MAGNPNRPILSDAEREQALAVISIAVKIIHDRVPWQLEHALLSAGEFLLTRGNRDRTPGGFKRKRELLLNIVDDCRSAVQS